MTISRGWQVLRRIFGGLGVPAALEYLYFHTLGLGNKLEYRIRPRGIAHPLIIRRPASDIDVLKQIYVDREYASIDDLPDVRLVIDCGANVGYSSAYFLSIFPQAQVVAVEPDPRNFATLERNLAPYGQRARCFHAGVWSQAAPLVIAENSYGDGRDWSRQVRVCAPSETADFAGVDIATLLAQSGHERISLLKVDIEGAEAVVFAENFTFWLERVDAIAIELHDDSMFGNGSEVFHRAIAGRGFKISHSGELTICRSI